MSSRKITVVGPDGERRQPGGVYIPGSRDRKRIEESAAKRNKAASPNAHQVGRTSVRREPDDDESLIGGMKATDIRAWTQVRSTPVGGEMSEEERHKIWQPPQRDTSRFKGTSASRHGAGRAYKDSADHPGGSFAAVDELPPARKKEGASGSKSAKKGRGAKPAKPTKPVMTTKPAKGMATISPLSPKELKKLDKAYRLHGADPQWRGWDTLLTGRTREFLLAEAKRCRLDRPDDSTWMRSERRVFDGHWDELGPEAPQWKTLLPRKSSAAIALQYQRGRR